jgi:hypothetical protein
MLPAVSFLWHRSLCHSLILRNVLQQCRFVGIFKILLMRIAIVAILTLFALSCKTGVDYPEGGYDYVKEYKPEDTGFYFLPVRDSFSIQDSFDMAWNSENIYSKLDEPNLSLKYSGHDVFRLIWSAPIGGFYLITLREHQITIKEMVGFDEPISNFANCYDTSKLNEVEKFHLRVLENNFPLQELKLSGWRKSYLDSLLKLYPQLLSSKYYYHLSKKIYCNQLKPKFSINTISITREQYHRTVDAINESGYWKLPVLIDGEIMCTDAGSYSLEASTTRKYNYVSSMECLEKSNLAFDKACQELVKLAKLEDKITIYWDGSGNHIDSAGSEGSELKVQEINMEPIQESPPKKSKKKK